MRRRGCGYSAPITVIVLVTCPSTSDTNRTGIPGLASANQKVFTVGDRVRRLSAGPAGYRGSSLIAVHSAGNDACGSSAPSLNSSYS